ncbi:haloacid dehalogenase-like hydrolase [Burkholderia ubonensis]|uniref:haloacid dehalogenase-like hydrolase n=1 Tax=Burkholderia ubonensis TaxID=101571 RepID=UPI0009B3076A
MRETRDLPLVVDLDGTLTTTDTLAESVIRAVRRKPASLLRFPFWLASGRSTFKARIAEQADLRVEHLPYRAPLVEYLEQEQQRGRRIILATAAHRSIAERVGEHLDLFDEVIATDGETNLKGEAKLESIRKYVGERFVYAGDSKADLPVWAAAQGAILAGAAPAVTATIRDTVRVERYDSDAFVNTIRAARAKAVIPPRSNRMTKRRYSRVLYRTRNIVERFLSRIKRFRRVATRYDKVAGNDLAFAVLACAFGPQVRMWNRT